MQLRTTVPTCSNEGTVLKLAFLFSCTIKWLNRGDDNFIVELCEVKRWIASKNPSNAVLRVHLIMALKSISDKNLVIKASLLLQWASVNEATFSSLRVAAKRTESNMQVYRENRKFIKSWLLHLLTIICIHSHNFKIGERSFIITLTTGIITFPYHRQTEFMTMAMESVGGRGGGERVRERSLKITKREISIRTILNWSSFGKRFVVCMRNEHISLV